MSQCVSIDFVQPNHASVGGLIHQDYFLMCGGYPDTNQCYSYIHDSWQATSLAENRTYAAAAPSPFPEDPFSLVIVGGKTNSSIYLSNDIWIENMPDLVKLNHHCVVKINSTTIMVIGGYHNDKRSNKTYILDITKNVWEEGPPLKQERDCFSCGRIKSDMNSSGFSIIVAGGWTGTSRLTSTEVFDAANGTWRPGPELPLPLCCFPMVEDADGGVVVVGGEGTRGDGTVIWHDTIFRLPHAGQNGTWVELPQKLNIARARHVAFMVPNNLVDCN